VFKRLSVDYHEHKVEVTNSWFTGAKLYIDDNLVDRNYGIFALNKNKTLMKASIQINDSEHLIEVFAWAPCLSVNIKICANGQQISGDRF
jgi:hypothetical protein